MRLRKISIVLLGIFFILINSDLVFSAYNCVDLCDTYSYSSAICIANDGWHCRDDRYSCQCIWFGGKCKERDPPGISGIDCNGQFCLGNNVKTNGYCEIYGIKPGKCKGGYTLYSCPSCVGEITPSYFVFDSVTKYWGDCNIYTGECANQNTENDACNFQQTVLYLDEYYCNGIEITSDRIECSSENKIYPSCDYCGRGIDSCTFNEYSCEGGGMGYCEATIVHDLDEGSGRCNLCNPNTVWVQGGESSSFGEYTQGDEVECCGDDSGENYITAGIGPAKCCAIGHTCVDIDGRCRSGNEGPSFGNCNDGIDNDCDEEVDCDDHPDCDNAPNCGGNACTLISAEITPSCSGGSSPYCETNDIILMSGEYEGNCEGYSFLFFQINATGGGGLGSAPPQPTCIIQFSGGDMRGISDNAPGTSGGSITGEWWIPDIPEQCEGIQVTAQIAELWDGDPGPQGNKITQTENVGGEFRFAGCDLTNAYWNKEEVEEGTEVELIVEGNDYCDGKEIIFDIYEYDNPSSREHVGTLSGPFDRTTWIAIWMNDSGFLTDDDPEYEFDARPLDGGETVTSKNQLKVTKGGWDCSEIFYCDAYPDQIPCDNDICGVVENSVPPGINCDDPDTICNCTWEEGRTPYPCQAEVTILENGNEIGTCVSEGDTDDDCNDGFLDYWWDATWTWHETNNYYKQHDCKEACTYSCVLDPDCGDYGCYRCDSEKRADCVSGGNTVPCSGQIRLPFFGIYNVLGVLIVIALIYFLMNYSGKKKKK